MSTARRFVLAGHPVAHSRSPAMFRAAFDALGLEHTYEAHDVDEQGFRALVQELRRGAIDGMNVTLPFKALALSVADDADFVAAAAGAANTLVRDRRDPDRIVAYNTDVQALVAELRRLDIATRRNGRAVVLGSGGAARAAVLALRDLGVGRITIRSRSRAAAESLAEMAPGLRLEPLEAGADADVDVVVQATSAGMRGPDVDVPIADAVSWADLPSSAVAYDVVYAPRDTRFVEQALAYGLRADSGLGMLVRQGAKAFELWLGVAAPIEVMRAAATEG